MQVQMNNKDYERFYFEIPINKKTTINAVKNLLKSLKIENKILHKDKEQTQERLAEFDSFVGIIKGSISDEEVASIRDKRYAK